MISRLATLSLAAALMLSAVPASFAQEEEVYADIERIHGDADGFFELFSTLQDAMMFGDPVTIAQYALYPLAVNDPEGNYEVMDEEEFLESFDVIFTPDSQQALLEQDPADLPPATAYAVSDLELASRLSFFESLLLSPGVTLLTRSSFAVCLCGAASYQAPVELYERWLGIAQP